MFYIGKAKPITDWDYYSIAKQFGVEEAVIRAVVEVEAAGKGFHSSGALTCLYEPHIAYRYTSGDVRKKLVDAGLAYRKWGEKPYPKVSFPRIDECAKIAGEEIACISTSWGLPQMMGFNHKVCGYPTALAMVKDFASGEAQQVRAMMHFIKANSRMFDAMKNKHWSTFAHYYNGPGYKKNKYNTKLDAAYKRWVQRLNGRPVPKFPDLADPITKPGTSPEVGLTFGAIIIAAVGFAMSWVADLPCKAFGIFCGG